MHNSKFKVFIVSVLALLLLSVAVLGVFDYIIPGNIAVFAPSQIPGYSLVDIGELEGRECASLSVTKYKTSAKLFGVIPIKELSVKVLSDIKLIPGGVPFGVKFYTDGVVAVGFTEFSSGGKMQSPARSAGLRAGDIITAVGGENVDSASAFTEAVKSSDGKAVVFSVSRGGKKSEVTITPQKSDEDGAFRIGMWVRDCTAGIGTVTFIEPDSLAFAGLGHGITDADTGALLPLLRGSVSAVTVTGVTRGTPGVPGELHGVFLGEGAGELLQNTDYGVFGNFSLLPLNATSEPVGICPSSELTEGAAEIICTLSGETPEKYDIEISNINRTGSCATKCFTVTVTDERLIERSGGIVQGMSGSPIIQNGRLAGAITHVLVGDPTSGYGIFIENMLEHMTGTEE